jgi:hypothetical protein
LVEQVFGVIIKENLLTVPVSIAALSTTLRVHTPLAV